MTNPSNFYNINYENINYENINFNVKRNFTDNTIKTAVNEWHKNKVNATNIYGHISNWDVSKVTNMSQLFMNKNFNEPLNWNTKNVTDMSSMFKKAILFDQSLNFDTTKVTNMSGMFFEAKLFNQPLDFNTKNVTDMSYMFYIAKSFNQSLDFNTEKVTNMSQMFYHAESFNKPLDFNTENVINMNCMFEEAVSFNQSLNFDTKNVYDMSSMFYGANLFNKPLTFNTENVTSMNYMFGEALFNKPLTFNTKKVINMEGMFFEAKLFNQPLDFNTENVINMKYMFQEAVSFNQSLNFDTTKVTNMESMFQEALSFNQPLNWNTENVTNMGGMFYKAILFNQDLRKWCVPKIKDMPSDFANQPAVYKNLPKFGKEWVCNFRYKLKKYENIDDEYNTIEIPDINNYTDIKGFYNKLSGYIWPDKFFEYWTVEVTEKSARDRMTDADDVGGLIKMLFSIFARQFLFHDPDILESKEKDLQSKTFKLKEEYIATCKTANESKSGILNSSSATVTQGRGKVGSYLAASSTSSLTSGILETKCEELKILIEKTEEIVDEEIINKQEILNKFGQGYENDLESFLRQLARNTNNNMQKNILLKILLNEIKKVWWNKSKKMLLKEYNKIVRDFDNIDKMKKQIKKQIKFTPFVLQRSSEDRVSFQFNQNLDETEIEKIFGAVDDYYKAVGLMLGKYITQDLDRWKSTERQYANDYIPIGKFFSLLILKGATNITKKQAKEAIGWDKSNKEYIEDALKLELEDNDSDPSLDKVLAVSSTPASGTIQNSASEKELQYMLSSSDKFVIKSFLALNDEDTLNEQMANKLIKHFYCGTTKKAVHILSFLEGIHEMVTIENTVTEGQLLKEFQCIHEEEKEKFIDLLNNQIIEKNLNQIGKIGKESVKQFIEIVKDMDKDKLIKLFNFVSGTSCCPSNVDVGFNSSNIYFTSHTCSNGLDFPDSDIFYEKYLNASSAPASRKNNILKKSLEEALDESLANFEFKY